MRTAFSLIAASLLVSAGPEVTEAQSPRDIAGEYQVKFSEVQSSCTDAGMKLRKATVELSQRGRSVAVKLPSVPRMTGRVSKGGKFKAKAEKGKTPAPGIDGRFSISGRVKDGMIQLVFIAEYYKNDKPLCTQSWNGSGVDEDKL